MSLLSPTFVSLFCRRLRKMGPKCCFEWWTWRSKPGRNLVEGENSSGSQGTMVSAWVSLRIEAVASPGEVATWGFRRHVLPGTRGLDIQFMNRIVLFYYLTVQDCLTNGVGSMFFCVRNLNDHLNAQESFAGTFDQVQLAKRARKTFTDEEVDSAWFSGNLPND